MARFVKKKGKPIMKGSSGSNPAMRTHRARARAKRSQPLGAIGEGAQAQRALTIAALAAHTRHTADADDAASMHIDVHPARLSAVASGFFLGSGDGCAAQRSD